MTPTLQSEGSAPRSKKSQLRTALVLLCILAAAYLTAIYDPLGWGTVQSDRFSWERFELIQPGDAIDKVVANLGDPVREPESLEIIDTGEESRQDPCFSRKCRTFRFHGARWARWPASYEEAIVVVGPDDRVVSRIRREE